GVIPLVLVEGEKYHDVLVDVVCAESFLSDACPTPC
ncbi:hypothetical protein A2U01_0019902, partial [Trifolium medium]|nr:hypothetical protein [Trifolium medium]